MFKNILRVGAEISILSKIGPGSLKGLNPAAGTEKKATCRFVWKSWCPQFSVDWIIAIALEVCGKIKCFYRIDELSSFFPYENITKIGGYTPHFQTHLTRSFLLCNIFPIFPASVKAPDRTSIFPNNQFTSHLQKTNGLHPRICCFKAFKPPFLGVRCYWPIIL